jgi:cob(I)alamin adenosyltransferase
MGPTARRSIVPRLTKIYTRVGDDGTTHLASGREVPKDAPRVQAYGAVDELNAQIGVALSSGLDQRLAEVLPVIQNELFHLGADLATPPSEGDEVEKFEVPRIESRHVTALETLIDDLNAVVGPLENFILPGGANGAAALQLARAVCRRAERRTMTLSREETVGDQVIPYLNRLSDALFVMARFENHQRGAQEPLWDPSL